MAISDLGDTVEGWRVLMDRPVIVVSADKKQTEQLCDFLEQGEYQTRSLHSLVNLGEKIQETACRIVILDLDTLPMDNRFVMELRRENPRLTIIGLSDHPFHPELKEAMSGHISACLGKPPDLDDLIYCVRSFCQNGVSSNEVPEEGESEHAKQENDPWDSRPNRGDDRRFSRRGIRAGPGDGTPD